MDIEEIKKLKSRGIAPHKITSRSSFKDNKINVNHKVAIEVESSSSYFEKGKDIIIHNSSDVEIGVLCFTKSLGPTNWNELTENQFIAFLNESNVSDIDTDYQFRYDYLILNDTSYDEYVNEYMDNSALWGGFIHRSKNPLYSHSKTINKIKASALKVDNNIFKENLIRAILQPFAHERFLKFYHLLELRFDFDVINDIQNIDMELNSEKIGEILSNYASKEFTRLKYIIQKNCTDIPPLVNCMSMVKNHDEVATQIFYKFGKNDSNPLKEVNDFVDLCRDGFDEDSLTRNKINFQKNYNAFITHLISYWIYRVRCSIAHNKIGEYILSHENENFIVEFAEPLLNKVLIQSFKK